MKKSKKIHRLNDLEFSELKAGAEEALAHAKGEKVTLRTRSLPRRQKPAAFSPARIRSIRRRLNVSQPVFAELLYVTKTTASKWEQGLRKPSGSALRLLEIAEKMPSQFQERKCPLARSDERSTHPLAANGTRFMKMNSRAPCYPNGETTARYLWG